MTTELTANSVNIFAQAATTRRTPEQAQQREKTAIEGIELYARMPTARPGSARALRPGLCIKEANEKMN